MHATGVCPLPPAVLSVTISLATQSHAVSAERKAPCFAVCALVCDLSSRAGCVPAFTHESERGPLARKAEKRNEERLGIKFMAAALPDFSLLLVLRVHREPGNVCI